MIVLGIILIVAGLLLPAMHILYVIGGILLVVGLVLLALHLLGGHGNRLYY